MLSSKLNEALNKQINNEFFSEFAYLSMAAYFHSIDLDGMANFFHVQAKEEHFHAMKMFNFVITRGGKVELQAMKAPQVDFKDVTEVFTKALEHEQIISKSINDIIDISIKENDHAVNSFLKWFVDEQVEEEATAQKNLSKIKLIGGKGEGLLMLDQELAARVFTEPAAQ